MRIAAIDIGTNSIHMLVVQVRPDLSFEVIDREKDMVRLRGGVAERRKLIATALRAARLKTAAISSPKSPARPGSGSASSPEPRRRASSTSQPGTEWMSEGTRR